MQSRIIFIKKSMRYRTEGTIPFTINKILLIFIWAADIIFLLIMQANVAQSAAQLIRN